MFASAKVIIGAPGAGLANMMWSAPGTVVIETGFDQCRDGCVDDTYYDMALGLGHQYHMALGGGHHEDYSERWPSHVIGIIKDGGQNRDVSNIRPRHRLEPVEPAALPPELLEPVLAPFTFDSQAKRSTVSTSTVSGPIDAIPSLLFGRVRAHERRRWHRRWRSRWRCRWEQWQWERRSWEWRKRWGEQSGGRDGGRSEPAQCAEYSAEHRGDEHRGGGHNDRGRRQSEGQSRSAHRRAL
jgi:hypothetical protein